MRQLRYITSKFIFAFFSFTVLALLILLPDYSFAQSSPFGVGRSEPAIQPSDWGPLSPIFAHIAVWQSELYASLSALVSSFRENPISGLWLVAFSFLYGVLHAAGPGHGKVVISSYLLATGETAKRGIVVSFAAAGVQALTAILLVSVLAGIFGATAKMMTDASVFLELASYAAVALVGVYLIARRLYPLLSALKFEKTTLATAGGGSLSVSHGGGHAQHHHSHHHDHSHEHHHHDHSGSCCGHSHSADPNELTGPLSLKQMWAAIISVGIRPCTGAIFVLIFTYSQGLFFLGILSALAMGIGTGLTVCLLALMAVYAKDFATKLVSSNTRMLAVSMFSIEILAALVVFAFGATFFMATLYRI